jgi:hypothetical protein
MQAVRTTAALAAAVLSLGLIACGEDESQSPRAAAPPQEPASERAEPVAEVENLSGRTTAVKLDSGFVEALETLQLTPGPVGEGKITESGSAVFPITGGNVTYYEPGTVSPYVQGKIEHEGSGLSLTGGGKTVELTGFEIDPEASVLTGDVSVDGQEAATDTRLFVLDGRSLKPLQANPNGTAVLEGTKVRLGGQAAALLNETFGVDALEEGLDIGVAKITVNTR